jgi:hypothetical protein
VRKLALRNDVIRDKSRIFTYAFGQFYTEMCRKIAISFHGDMDAFFILFAIANNSVSPIMRDAEKANLYRNMYTPIEDEFICIKLLPLSEVTGLPRTTVRRKVQKLEQLGYVERLGSDGYRVKKGKMVECPVIGDILQTQLELVSRFLNFMMGGEMIAGPGADSQTTLLRTKRASARPRG